MKNTPGNFIKRQCGASMVEFTIAAPVLFMVGLGTLQAGMLYHSKSIINYATFEAARVGATRHAMPEPMMDELGLRLAPLFGGNGTMEKAAEAMARSAFDVKTPINLDGTVAPATDIKILNPTQESFDKWGVPSLEVSNRTAIPNSHLRHQDPHDGAGTAAMTLADANLLKIQVTHGVELKIPFINSLILETLEKIEESKPVTDPVKLAYYQAGRIPITSTATVRMQSEAWQEALELVSAPPPFVNPPDPVLGLAPGGGSTATPLDPTDPAAGSCNDNGLLATLLEPDLSYGACPVAVGTSDGADGGGGSTCT